MKSEDYSKMFNSFRNAQYTVRYASKMNRKRQIVNKLLDELHNSQLEMIDRAVDQSDLSQAREVIDHIRSL
jgi:plasmid maintenance system killer protein